MQGRLTTGALKAFGGAVLALLVARLTRAGVGFMRDSGSPHGLDG